MNITRESNLTGRIHIMKIPGISMQDITKFHNGNQLIQDAFPNLTPDEREFILTGITPEEWDSVFPEE